MDLHSRSEPLTDAVEPDRLASASMKKTRRQLSSCRTQSSFVYGIYLILGSSALTAEKVASGWRGQVTVEVLTSQRFVGRAMRCRVNRSMEIVEWRVAVSSFRARSAGCERQICRVSVAPFPFFCVHPLIESFAVIQSFLAEILNKKRCSSLYFYFSQIPVPSQYLIEIQVLRKISGSH